MREFVKPFLISMVFAAIPYVLVAWGYTKFTNGDAQAFWVALGVLIGLRLFFAIIEMMGGILYWRLYGRRIALDKALKFLKANDCPPRKHKIENIISYLAGIYSDPEYPVPLRISAFGAECTLRSSENYDRTLEVWNAALDVYAPEPQATHHL